MDAQFLAGLIIGAGAGAGGMAVVFAWRRWRGAIAAVPAARAGVFTELKSVAIFAVLCAAAVLIAIQ